VSPFHNPFGALGERYGIKPGEAAAPPPAEAAQPAPPAGVPVIARAVVRIERAGRGGKDVTVIEQLSLSPTDRNRWLKALKTSLGCGGVVEGESLVLQGDHRDRLPALLTARGVRKVTVAR
jgi:translation initiation factor 1